MLHLTVWKTKGAVWHSYVETLQSLPKEFLILTTIAFYRKTAPRLSNEAWIAGGLEREQCFADWFGYVF